MHFGEQMAIYHFTCKYVSRAGDANKNAVRSAAYCAGEELSDMNTGATFNYSNKSEVVFSEIQAPANAPEWVADRQRLWSEVEKKEVRYDAKLMSQFEASLPNELDLEQCKALMYDFSSASIVKRGMVSDWSIHWVLHNQHVHVNATTREITGEGFGKKVREWEEKKTLFALRKEWAECVNKHLAMAGFDVRIDHRSFKDQGIDQEPTVHVGPERAHNQEVVADRKARNRRTRSRNRIVDADKKADAAIKELESKVKLAKEQLEVVVAREKKNNLKKRIVNSVQNLNTQPTPNTHKKPPQSVSKSTFPAPADLYENIIKAHFAPQSKVVSKPEPPIAIVHTCWELRLPNGKVIIPQSFHALEQTIKAWELTDAEAIKLKSDFWKLSSQEYYDWFQKHVFEKNATKVDKTIFENYVQKDLDNLKEAGLSPAEKIEQCLKGNKLKHSLKYYYKQICNLAKTKGGIEPAFISPFDVCYGYQHNQPFAEIANKSIEKNKMHLIPEPVNRLLMSKITAADHDAIQNYCINAGLNHFQTSKFMELWWEQITFDDYHKEVRQIALKTNKIMKLDMVPIDRIREQFNYRLSSPADCLSFVSTGGGTGGFNPTPGALPPSSSPTQQAPSNPWSNSKGSGSYDV